MTVSANHVLPLCPCLCLRHAQALPVEAVGPATLQSTSKAEESIRDQGRMGTIISGRRVQL